MFICAVKNAEACMQAQRFFEDVSADQGVKAISERIEDLERMFGDPHWSPTAAREAFDAIAPAQSTRGTASPIPNENLIDQRELTHLYSLQTRLDSYIPWVTAAQRKSIYAPIIGKWSGAQLAALAHCGNRKQAVEIARMISELPSSDPVCMRKKADFAIELIDANQTNESDKIAAQFVLASCARKSSEHTSERIAFERIVNALGGSDRHPERLYELFASGWVDARMPRAVQDIIDAAAVDPFEMIRMQVNWALQRMPAPSRLPLRGNPQQDFMPLETKTGRFFKGSD